MPQYFVEGTNFLYLDELQVNGEGNCYTEMVFPPDICNDNDDVDVVREANSDHSLGDIQQGAHKVGKATVFFRFPSKSSFLLALIRISSGCY
jgi:hypothetical protein